LPYVLVTGRPAAKRQTAEEFSTRTSPGRGARPIQEAECTSRHRKAESGKTEASHQTVRLAALHQGMLIGDQHCAPRISRSKLYRLDRA
jgi:hypothetical protein